jgi:hypothetical protein
MRPQWEKHTIMNNKASLSTTGEKSGEPMPFFLLLRAFSLKYCVYFVKKRRHGRWPLEKEAERESMLRQCDQGRKRQHDNDLEGNRRRSNGKKKSGQVRAREAHAA